MKTRGTLFIFVVLALVLLTACSPIIPSPDGADSAYQKITADDGRELLESGADFTLVDVRRADEYEAAHIPSAINIPNETIESTRPAQLPELNKTIVVYCRTGVRSRQAADNLVRMGYTDVRDMGGIANWPYDTVSGAEPGEYVATGGDTTSDGIMGRFTAKDLDGNNINQGIFANSDLTMVNVWATYCGPCLSEMPELGELAKEYENKGVRIVGMVSDVLNSDGTANDRQLNTARDIVARTGAGYLHIVPSSDLFGLLSQISAVPTTFFVDSRGAQVGGAYLGSRSKAEWNEIIVQTLATVQK